MRKTGSVLRGAMLALALAILPGCLAAAGAGAGAASAAYLTGRSASSVVEGSLEDVAEDTRATFREMGIEPTGEQSSDSGNDLEIRGRNGELDLVVDLERTEPRLTLVEVSARANTVTWNEEYAKMVLNRIIKK